MGILLSYHAIEHVREPVRRIAVLHRLFDVVAFLRFWVSPRLRLNNLLFDLRFSEVAAAPIARALAAFLLAVRFPRLFDQVLGYPFRIFRRAVVKAKCLVRYPAPLPKGLVFPTPPAYVIDEQVMVGPVSLPFTRANPFQFVSRCPVMPPQRENEIVKPSFRFFFRRFLSFVGQVQPDIIFAEVLQDEQAQVADGILLVHLPLLRAGLLFFLRPGHRRGPVSGRVIFSYLDDRSCCHGFHDIHVVPPAVGRMFVYLIPLSKCKIGASPYRFFLAICYTCSVPTISFCNTRTKSASFFMSEALFYCPHVITEFLYRPAAACCRQRSGRCESFF